MADQLEDSLDAAVAAITSADALLIGAGAGMGVDSGLPDFRGNEGFWRAYPAFNGRRFSEMSNPRWFSEDPELAWGFFGHRYNLYSKTEPHDGFRILQSISERLSNPAAIFTSNVDGHFQKAGFAKSQVVECHGSIHHLQCSSQCSPKIWRPENLKLEVDEEIRLTSELPRCPFCDDVARPNILMFSDRSWNSARTERQERRFRRWLNENSRRNLVVVEIGAGTAIPTVRYTCESTDAPIIRINPRDPQGPDNVISIPLGGLEALRRIESLLTV